MGSRSQMAGQCSSGEACARLYLEPGLNQVQLWVRQTVFAVSQDWTWFSCESGRQSLPWTRIEPGSAVSQADGLCLEPGLNLVQLWVRQSLPWTRFSCESGRQSLPWTRCRCESGRQSLPWSRIEPGSAVSQADSLCLKPGLNWGQLWVFALKQDWTGFSCESGRQSLPQARIEPGPNASQVNSLCLEPGLNEDQLWVRQTVFASSQDWS